MPTLDEIARELAAAAHAGQFRRDGVTPYLSHPAAVAMRLKNESEEVIAAAWLHDVLEDTTTTKADLEKAGIPAPVIQAVAKLTHEDAVAYELYLTGIKGDPICKKVKIADMLSNLADSPTDRQILKYARGLTLLLS